MRLSKLFLEKIINSLHQSIYRYPQALNYLYGRGVTDEDIRKFKIGYSKIVPVLDDSSKEYERFLEESSRGKKLENKVVFPICDCMGQVVGVVGRDIEVKVFKVFVLETAKTLGFFFGLNYSLPYIYEKNVVFVVEGVFDFLALKKVIPNCVATLTSHLSDAQYEFLQAYCDIIIIVFDSDEVGFRGKDKLREYKNVYSMSLGYKDPSKCLNVLGESEFKAHVKNKLKTLPIF